MRLSPEEARVIASLTEKQLTTPQQYPLTAASLLVACNQSSNRAPVVHYDERTVNNALATLKAAGLVRFVHPSHGRSVTRYEQLLGEQLAISNEQLALLGVLMLRGAQTVGELRSRTERMCDFEGMAQVELELERLSKLPEPLVTRVLRRPGQKEERWAQLLSDSSEGPLSSAALPGSAVSALGPGAKDGPEPQAGADLAAQVDQLRAELADLRAQLDALRRDFLE
ncbi:MAG TPA: DUF480 domain-containing protein [Acidimicrobiales bacterium]|nr:DUF480 domain-containing protein [Acidimicrobiales bacterium]